MQAYVINLDRRPDRWEQISAHLTELGISFERISAVDGKTWDGKGWKKQGRTREDYWRGAAGCYFSHLRALETAIERDTFPSVILEDDAMLDCVPEPQPGMTYLGWFGEEGETYGLHAVMYNSASDVRSFMYRVQHRKNTIDSIANAYRKTGISRVRKYDGGRIAHQRLSYSDIEGGVVERTEDGKIRWKVPTQLLAQEHLPPPALATEPNVPA
jgi:hypothetical protein